VHTDPLGQPDIQQLSGLHDRVSVLTGTHDPEQSQIMPKPHSPSLLQNPASTQAPLASSQ